MEGRRERVEALRRKGYDSEQAEQLLATFEAAVESMRNHLDEEQKPIGNPGGASR